MTFISIQTQAPVNRFRVHDGTDAGAAMKAGLELTGICVVGIALILTLYYASLRILAACFPPKAEQPGDDQ